MTGKGTSDFRRANEAAGFGKGSKPPVIDGVEYTWHHVEDGETMQLIPRKIHQKFPHTGGASISRRSGGKQ